MTKTRKGTKDFIKFIGVLLLIAISFSGLFTILAINYLESVENPESVEGNETPPPSTATPVEPSTVTTVKEKYWEILEIPYVLDLGPTKSPSETLSLNQGDCDDKAVLFADWLYQQGYRDIYIVIISGPYVEYAHTFVVFDDGVYDLTDPQIFNCTREEAMDYFSLGGYSEWREYEYYPGWVVI